MLEVRDSVWRDGMDALKVELCGWGADFSVQYTGFGCRGDRASQDGIVIWELGKGEGEPSASGAPESHGAHKHR
jgi:hypothetical protein